MTEQCGLHLNGLTCVLPARHVGDHERDTESGARMFWPRSPEENGLPGASFTRTVGPITDEERRLFLADRACRYCGHQTSEADPLSHEIVPNPEGLMQELCLACASFTRTVGPITDDVSIRTPCARFVPKIAKVMSPKVRAELADWAKVKPSEETTREVEAAGRAFGELLKGKDLATTWADPTVLHFLQHSNLQAVIDYLAETVEKLNTDTAKAITDLSNQLSPTVDDKVNAFTFTVPGQPMAQPRARFARVGGHVRTYDPAEAKNYKDTVRACYFAARGDLKRIEEGPIRLAIAARFERPASKCSKRNPRPAEWMAGGKDADNVAKIIMDALNHVAWKDDRLVAYLLVRKVLCAQGEAPSVTVTFGPLEPGGLQL